MIVNNWKRNWEYLKINFYLTYKKLVEYKVNFWTSLIEQIFYIATTFLFLSIIFKEFNDIVNWDLIDFAIYFFIIDTLRGMNGLFTWKKGSLSEYIISGKLNTFFIKPLNRHFSFFCYEISTAALFYIIFNIIILTILIYLSNYSILNILYGLLIFFSLLIFLIIWNQFLISFALIGKKLDILLVSLINFKMNDFFEMYPSSFFKTSNYKNILFLLPNFYIGMLLMPILKGTPIWHLEIQLSILFSLIIIFSIGTYINWKHGLKKYEAYD